MFQGILYEMNASNLVPIKSLAVILAVWLVVVGAASAEDVVRPGKEHFDDAIRQKINATNLPDLNKVIDHLQKALDLGLDEKDSEFAELMMSDSLMQRAAALQRVVTTESIRDRRVQQIVRQVISDLRRVLSYADPPADAYFMLGKLMCLPGGDAHEARRLLTSFLKFEDLSKAKQAEALALRGRVQSEESKALDDIDQAIALEPGSDKYRMVRAVFLRDRKRHDDALEEISKLLDQSPDNASVLLLQGEVFRAAGDLEAAIESFGRAGELAPQSVVPNQQLGEIHRINGDYEEALKQFSEVLARKPEEVITLIHRAEIYLRKKRFEEALADVDKVLEKQPMLVLARRLRAEVLFNMERQEDAIKEMTLLVEAAPKELELKLQLALYLQFNRQNGEAIEIYSQVLEQEPANAEVLRTRGDAYLTQGDHAEAIADFEAALELTPEDTPLLNNLAWVLATSPDDVLRDGKRAVELATKACDLTEYSKPHILSTLAAAFAESGDFDNAIEWSEKAVAMDDTEQEEQLSKELSSYRGGQPWRERQTLDSAEDTPEMKVDESALDPIFE